MRINRMLSGLFAAAILTGCVAPGQSAYVLSMQKYQGQTEAQVIDALGPPDKTYDVGGTRYITYVKASQQVYQGNPSYVGGFGVDRRGALVGSGIGVGFGHDLDSETEVYTSRCDVYFAIINHRVNKVGYRGPNC